MCYGGVDLKHLVRETESRLAGLPKVDAAPAPVGAGRWVRAFVRRLGLIFADWRGVKRA
ncbi:MAG: hypothetical protein ACRC6I_12145 [Paracoccaceae bacterium]